MCGIAGIIGVAADRARPALPRMLRAMGHRGPNDSGTQIISSRSSGNDVFLIHARLAILDLTPAGHQPMADHPLNSDTPPNHIVFNGEVFNYQDLHEPLSRNGWACRSQCDTEVILNAYRVWGEECVTQFRGMFAWCLIDTQREIAWFCRDRLGVKPLYLARPPSGGLLFASELRTLLAAGPDLVPPTVSPAALESFLAQGAVCGMESIVDNVRLLMPGESLVTDWTGRQKATKSYWRIPFMPEQSSPYFMEPSSRARAVRKLAETLREAVKIRLISDVPLGLFLSGGVDSSALATIATEVSNTAIQTVNIGFDQPEWDESEAALSVAQTLGTEHHVLRLTGHDILADLPTVLAAVDQPTVDGFNTYYVSRAARRAGLTVALSGLGGDELFGGYASFHDVPRALRMQQWMRYLGGLRQAVANGLGKFPNRRAAKIAQMLGRDPTSVALYLLRRELFLPAERRDFFPKPSNCDPNSGMSFDVLLDLAVNCSGLDPLNQVSYLEIATYMRNMLLRDADVFGMANGLEIRTPLLDHRLVEQVVALPGLWKMPRPYTKPLLIDAVGPRFPAAVLTRPKRGFTFPWAAWLRGPLRQRATKAVENRELWAHLGLAPDAPTRIWTRFLAKDRRVAALQVVALMVFEDYAVRHGLRSSSSSTVSDRQINAIAG